MELLIDYVMTRKEAAETHLASTSAAASRKAHEKFRDFHTFWSSFARLCQNYGDAIKAGEETGGMFDWLVAADNGVIDCVPAPIMGGGG